MENLKSINFWFDQNKLLRKWRKNMGKWFMYQPDYYKEEGLKAFSVNDDGEMYYYYLNSYKFRGATRLTDVLNITLPPGAEYRLGIFGLIIANKKKKKRKNDIKAYYSYIGHQNILGEIIKKKEEDKAGSKITRITSVKRDGRQVKIHCRRLDENGKEIADLITVYDNLIYYNDFLKAVDELCQKTKDICAVCGSIMRNGICYKCGSTQVKKEISKKMIILIALLVGLFAFLCGSVITYLHARENEDSTLLLLSIFGFMLSLTAIGYCKQGIEKQLK